MPGVTPLRPDDVRSARAWAAFVADDATASAPASLEARVMRAAQAALAQKQRDDAERRRRHWFAGLSAVAAGLLVAAAWSLTPGGLAPSRGVRPAQPPDAAAAPATAVATAPVESSAQAIDERTGRPVPMTNIEGGRVLATPPAMLLASRPLFDPIDGARPVRAPGTLRGKSFGGPTVEPAFSSGRPTHSIAPSVAIAATPPAPLTPAVAPVAATAPEAWSSRSFQGVFDPQAGEAGEKPAPAPVRLDHAAPIPAPAPVPPADPPTPPK
jgi:hypothetical protein